MITRPKISVVIVNWKTPELLARCLESIEKAENVNLQEKPPKVEKNLENNLEIHIVDNDSQDGSVEMIKERFPAVLLTENNENVGFSRACNQVIPQCTGDSVLLLNPDTIVMENAISKLSNFLQNHPNTGAVGPKVLNEDGTLQLACRRAFPSLEASFFRLTYLSHLFPKSSIFARYNLGHLDENEIADVDALSGSCMMVRKSVIDEIGLLDEDIFMFGEDIDWCWRIKQLGLRVVYIPDSVIYHVHGAAARKRPIGATINLHKGMEVFYRKHLAKKYWAPINLLVYAAIWSRALAFVLVNLVRGSVRRGRPTRDP